MQAENDLTENSHRLEKLVLILIVKDQSDREFYCAQLSSYDFVNILVFGGISQFQSEIKELRFAGVAIDIKTVIRADGEEKVFFTKLINCFPVLRMRRVGSHEFSGLIEGNSFSGKQLIESFIENYCTKLGNRGMRFFERKQIALNIFLYLSNDFSDQNAIKANIWNVSENGFYIVSQHEELNIEYLWLVINELKDKTPIKCAVKWSLSWGLSIKRLPGFGVEIIDISDDQIFELREIVKKHSS